MPPPRLFPQIEYYCEINLAVSTFPLNCLIYDLLALKIERVPTQHSIAPNSKIKLMPVFLGVFRTLITCAASVLLLTSIIACSGKTENNLTIIKALDESLVNSNDIIARQSQLVLMTLKNKLDDPVTHEKASLWYPKALYIQKLSADITVYIENLKIDLKKESGLEMDNGVESFKQNNTKAVRYLFNTKQKGKELYENLKKYKEGLFKIDSQMTSAFDGNVIITTRSFDSPANKQKDFTRAFFDHIPSLAAIALLNKFQNNIKITEYRMLSFWNTQASSMPVIRDFETTWPIVFQSSSFVIAAEEIEITAGVGMFTRSAQPRIIINGRTIETDATGVAVSKIKASSKPGRHYIPVKIDYIDQDGEKVSMTKNVEYTVAKEN
jgi:gliding motility-associated protein GldM